MQILIRKSNSGGRCSNLTGLHMHKIRMKIFYNVLLKLMQISEISDTIIRVLYCGHK